MRTIKFRVWDKTNKIMWQPALKLETDRPQRLALDVQISDDINPKPPYIWLQYTGLLDKNGKEIYEGDIVKHLDIVKGIKGSPDEVSEHSAQVVFEDGMFQIEGEMYGTLMAVVDNGCEVIGNIYESPELLTAPIKENI